jgi:hypothetical protein
MSLTNYELLTFRDAIEHVVDVFAGPDAELRTWRNARQAVREAYRDLPTLKTWHYYARTQPITTQASQTTGTIVYDHTGGTYERMITLSGATWPTDVRYWQLLIGRSRYEIEDRKSSTIITLEEWSNPGADLASTAYTAYRDTYPLPDYYLSMGRLVDVTSGARMLAQVNPDEVLVANRGVLTTSLPSMFAIIKAPHYAGGEAIQFGPSPTTARRYDAVLKAKGRPLTFEREYTGTISVPAGSTAVTGVSTAFSSAMAGSILRVGTAASLPTGPRGNIEASEADNPAVEQWVIKSVTDATHLTLESASVGTYAACKYTISDPLDLDSSVMLNFFLRLCEAKFARLEGREDRFEREQKADAEYRNAAASDNRSFAQDESYRGPFRLRDLATSVNFN